MKALSFDRADTELDSLETRDASTFAWQNYKKVRVENGRCGCPTRK